jgi:hypothetical protein
VLPRWLPACRWGLGVLMYVLLTGRQPFSTPKTDDPMVVMRRIVDENYQIKYPPYLSPQAKVGSADAHGTAASTQHCRDPWYLYHAREPSSAEVVLHPLSQHTLHS